MKPIFYLVIPLVIFLVIFFNALFGHLIFASDPLYATSKYSVYVHLLSEWSSDSKNIIFDVTNSWQRQGVDNRDIVFDAESKEYNINDIRRVDGKSYVELEHEFSDCKEEWQPVLYRRIIDSTHHGIEYMLGEELSTDSNISIYPDVDNASYDDAEQQLKIKNGYARFFPTCTLQTHTSYDFSIRIDDADIGFDVYFVPSSNQVEAFYSDDFEHYLESGCYGQNKNSYSGTCNDVQKSAGLLVVLPDELWQSTTKITINMYER